MATQARNGGYLTRPQPSGLAEVVDLILDKGLVIDAYVRVSLVGIEVVTIDARIVVASVDTYLRFAEAVNRLDLSDQAKGFPELAEDAAEATLESGARRKVEGTAGTVREKIEGVREKLEDVRDKVGDKVEEAREKIG